MPNRTITISWIVAAAALATGCHEYSPPLFGETVLSMSRVTDCAIPTTIAAAAGKGDAHSTVGAGPHVNVTKESLSIDEKIQFASNQAVILPVSDALLDEIAKTINAHPEIKRIEVGGHASADGASFTNRYLSQARAAAVTAALVRRGVKRSALTAKGYGPDKPIASNDTEEGREKNRRVEFLIVGSSSPNGSAAKSTPAKSTPAKSTPAKSKHVSSTKNGAVQ